jgi:membrane-bound lytic murein transglycosylase D
MNQLLRFLLIGLVLAGFSGPASAAPRDFPRPASLERDVAFWKRIYAEVGTDAGLLHDTRNLGIVYEVTKIPAGLSGRSRERHTDKRKKHFKTILRKLASGKRSGLSREEKRVLALFGDNVSNKTLKNSSDRVRFQLGQANKFRAGIIRSGAYKPHILATLREMNLPLEISNLPHVESSYTPSVYSRVGAAGLWQFTRSTGRRFMQVDHVVDERLDPYRASIAAARLLEQNYRVTGSWPLAITAYNHGASGMRRAARKLGTKDITKIVREYRSRTFGFASRNFYVEFLAANEVASDAERYFGPLALDQPIAFDSIEMPYYAKASELEKSLGVDRNTLKEANPSLRETVWQGAKYIPKGFELRVPRASLPKPLALGVSSLAKHHQHSRQTRDTNYVVRRGDTLSTIARRHHVRMSDLVALNGLKSRNRIRVGQKLKLPSDAMKTATSKASYTPPAKQAESSPKKAGASASLPNSGYYMVQRGDNLTRIADRFGMSVADLVAMNDLRSRHRIAAGQRLRVSTDASSTPSSPPSSPPSTPRSSPSSTKQAETLTASAKPAGNHPDGAAELSPSRSASQDPSPRDFAELAATDEAEKATVEAISDESPIEPSPGLLADPSDYTVASNGTVLVQTNETLGHYAEWLGLRASRLRKINGLRFGEPVVVQQRLRLDFSSVKPEDFERIRIEYHRSLQEDFFAEWEIEGTLVHRVGPGDSLWVLSTRRFDVPIWLLRQYNPDVDLNALSAGTPLTVPKLRQRNSETSAADGLADNAATG